MTVDLILIVKSVIMGLVEGITEFLPISSTGHLILTGDLLNFPDPSQRGIYEVFIQLGAVLAVVWHYRMKLIATTLGVVRQGPQRTLFLGVTIAFIPAVVLGLLLGDTIKAVLFRPVPVALAFIVGGLLILWAEKRTHTIKAETLDDVSLKQAFIVGLAQCLAMIPGTSRSGATIIGGLFLGLSRKAATEFSFFLGIPTLAGAALYSLYKARNQLSTGDIEILAVGLVVSFLSALVVIRALLYFISKHSFVVFAWYRIAFGAIVLATAYFGIVEWTDF
jgi:undecaprenyl-diphosphatase